jgi:hypothetical protein
MIEAVPDLQQPGMTKWWTPASITATPKIMPSLAWRGAQ